jgi:hypothetical protein
MSDETQASLVPELAAADNNIISRFETLRLLLDQGLITPEEYKVRRTANIGALLPLASPPPAAGLDRPLPPAEQISARLRAIGRALKMRAMTVTQHSAERSMILDALLPSAPVVVANPAVPPSGLMEAADSVRRLEYLRAAGLITSDEYSKERAAIESAMQPAAPKNAGSAPAAAATPGAKKTNAPMGRRPAVHLASYRSPKNAARGWATLKKSYGSLLGGLNPSVERVNLGRGKGVFYRLKAGPLDSQAQAKALCGKLKRRRQYCQPTFLGAS